LARAIDPVRTGHEVPLFSLPLKPERVFAACQRVVLVGATSPQSHVHWLLDAPHSRGMTG
jgi:hypothetical protein